MNEETLNPDTLSQWWFRLCLLRHRFYLRYDVAERKLEDSFHRGWSPRLVGIGIRSGMIFLAIAFVRRGEGKEEEEATSGVSRENSMKNTENRGEQRINVRVIYSDDTESLPNRSDSSISFRFSTRICSRRGEVSFFFSFSWERKEETRFLTRWRVEKDGSEMARGTVIIFAPSENRVRRHELIQPFPLSTRKYRSEIVGVVSTSHDPNAHLLGIHISLDASHEHVKRDISVLLSRCLACVLFAARQLGSSQIFFRNRNN